ncbi:phage prohead protease, HK97 family [Nitrosomonas sp. Is79A3]|uniref:HK97 family phage prohead protease n=1 Tax=Nitrosomonas sp. (strain Is79A3) TaxID=261292 RepID=UPI000215CA2A
MHRINCNLMELKFASSDDKSTNTGVMEFSGYGAVFENVDSYGDMIRKGAFIDTLKEARKTGNWPSLLLQHGGFGFDADDMMPIGIIDSMEEDKIGLKIYAVLADIQRARDAYALMKMTPRPAISGLSIGYIPVAFENGTEQGGPRRILTKIKLMEVSLVTFPANDKARITDVKSDGHGGVRIAEQALREAGFSRNEAKRILAHGYKSVGQCDAEEMDGLAMQIKRNIAILSN